MPRFELACSEFCAGGSAGEHDVCRVKFYGDRENELGGRAVYYVDRRDRGAGGGGGGRGRWGRRVVVVAAAAGLRASAADRDRDRGTAGRDAGDQGEVGALIKTKTLFLFHANYIVKILLQASSRADWTRPGVQFLVVEPWKLIFRYKKSVSFYHVFKVKDMTVGGSLFPLHCRLV